MSEPSAASSVLRRVLRLSVGTSVVQGLALVGQAVFALLLTPTDFGVWASASAAVFVLAGLVNFGEVNGYLASPAMTLAATRKAIWRWNAVLVLLGLLVAAAYSRLGQSDIALYIVLLAVNLPLLGETLLLSAACMKSNRGRLLVTSQTVAAVGRLVVGVGVAWLTHSPLAFALSMITYSLALIVVLSLCDLSEPASLLDVAAVQRSRLAWGAQSLSQTLPTQADFFAISLTGRLALLGVYFLAYQATVALSGLIVSSLSGITLVELSKQDTLGRRSTAATLLSAMTHTLGAVSCVLAGALLLAGAALPDRWEVYAPTVVILLASLPARIVTPLTDALQMSESRWWRSSSLNVVDALGTAVAGLSAVSGSVIVVATCIAGWKLACSLLRLAVAFGGVRQVRGLRSAVPVVGYGAVLVIAGVTWSMWSALLLLAALSLSGYRLVARQGVARSDDLLAVGGA